MAFSENLDYLYVGKIDGSINIYDSDKLILIEKQKQHNNAIVEISCHSIIYVSACVNGVINIWQTKTSKLLFSLNNEYGISCVTLTNDALNILVGYEMSEIKLISVKSKQVL
jgi:WD40 repeat protein